MEKVKAYYRDSCHGWFYMPASTEEEMHEFGLYDSDGKRISTGYFKDAGTAMEKAEHCYGSGRTMTVKDLTEEDYRVRASMYRDGIKKVHRSFKKSNLVLDMTKLYISRTPENWYTFIPFTYNGEAWSYRESAGSEWVQKETD